MNGGLRQAAALQVDFKTTLRRRTVRPSQTTSTGGRLMGRDDSDLDHACAAFVFSWSRFSTCSHPGRLKTCPTESRRDTRPFAEPHAKSDATPQSRDRCCRERIRRRVIPMTRIPKLIPRRSKSSRTHTEQPNQLARGRQPTDRLPWAFVAKRFANASVVLWTGVEPATVRL